MRLYFSISMILAILLCCPAYARLPDSGVQNSFSVPHVPGQLVIGLVTGTDTDVVGEILAAFDAVVLDEHGAGDLVVVGLNSDGVLELAQSVAVGDPRVEFAEPNYIYQTNATPNDMDFSQQWSKRNTGVNAPTGLGTPDADLNLTEAWDIRADASDTVIAIIDDSLDTLHTDLLGNVSPNGKCFASPNSSRPCTNGANDPSPADSNDFHGTLVAGTAGARGNNGIGIAGTAWQVTLLPLKVDLTTFAIVSAIDEAIEQGAHIVNMSFGGPVQSAAQSEALDRAESAGLLVVASAGNAGANNDIAVHFPSDATQRNVLSVAATNANDYVSSFSEWGSTSVHLAAPGEGVLTTANDSAFATVNGTSFSAPHVAGVAALIHAQTNAPDYRQLKAHLLHGGVDGVTALGAAVPGQDKRAVPGRVATGRLDAALALDGPAGGVLLIESVAVNDATTGNGNGRLDPGETASVAITLRNHWQTAIDVAGVLGTTDSGLLTINELSAVSFGTLEMDSAATANFSVSLSSAITGNEQLLLELVLTSAAGDLPSRYAYLEVGTLQNGETVSADIQRWNWDEFQSWIIDVPAGANNLVVSTTGSGDIDLLLRAARSPEYLITLNAPQGSGFYYVDADTEVSAAAGANESLFVSSPLPGSWHAVVVNYDQGAKSYDITASYDMPGTDIIAFTRVNYSAAEQDGTAVIEVSRSGGLTGATVDYTTAADSATAGSDYTETSGTLIWSAGENGIKSFTIELVDDDAEESVESVQLSLSNPIGATLGGQSGAVLSIEDNDEVTSAIEFAAANYDVDESGGAVTLTIERTGSGSGAISAEYETRGLSALTGEDFDPASGVLEWGDGDATPRTISVTINNDQSQELAERFLVVLQSPSNAMIGQTREATVTINDDDGPVPGPPAPVVENSGGGGAVGIGALLFGALVAIRRRQFSLPWPVVDYPVQKHLH